VSHKPAAGDHGDGGQIVFEHQFNRPHYRIGHTHGQAYRHSIDGWAYDFPDLFGLRQFHTASLVMTVPITDSLDAIPGYAGVCLIFFQSVFQAFIAMKVPEYVAGQ
jgi:hypothetical protein